MSWTDQLDRQVIALWNEGFSAGEICRRLPSLSKSRNAVIGRLSRLRKRGDERIKRDISTGHKASQPRKIWDDNQSLMVLQGRELNPRRSWSQIARDCGSDVTTVQRHYNQIIDELTASEAA